MERMEREQEMFIVLSFDLCECATRLHACTPQEEDARALYDELKRACDVYNSQFSQIDPYSRSVQLIRCPAKGFCDVQGLLTSWGIYADDKSQGSSHQGCRILEASSG